MRQIQSLKAAKPSEGMTSNGLHTTVIEVEVLYSLSTQEILLPYNIEGGKIRLGVILNHAIT